MNEQRVSVKLIGPDDDGGLVGLDSLAAMCRSLSKCLKCADTVVRPNATPLRFRVVELHASSAVICVEPKSPSGDCHESQTVVDFFKSTVASLQAGRVVDPRLTFDDLDAFRKLAMPLSRAAKEIWIGGLQITTRYVATIERIMGTAIPSIGQVSGRLDAIYAHGRSDFVLFPIAGPSVTCTFHEDMFEQVRNALRRTVTVHGTLHFQPDQPFPSRVQATRIEVHPPNDKLPKLRDLRGVSKRCTGKLSSVDFVRAIRDE